MRKSLKKQRCIVSGKIVDGKEVVLKEYAKDYVIMNGDLKNEDYA